LEYDSSPMNLEYVNIYLLNMSIERTCEMDIVLG
jgi:hypothetical protein